VKGYGSFKSAHEVNVNLSDGSGETTLQAKNIIIATGSEPSSVPGLTIDEDKCASLCDRRDDAMHTAAIMQTACIAAIQLPAHPAPRWCSAVGNRFQAYAGACAIAG
jgi:pyruvate/2-oxoglutarate dehydrogenase complex dihydrolipoamide dehydrogenase (E3) component